MATPLQSPGHAEEPVDDRQPLVVDRRKFLTYAVGGTALTIAAYTNIEGFAPARAAAQPVPSGPHPIDEWDLGDILTASYRPTMNLMRLEVTEEGRARFELPRTEVGQGITTAFAMVIADELGVDLDQVDVPYSDARPELLYNMLTGGSCSMRALIPTVRSMCAAARGQLVRAAANQLDYPAGTLRVANGRITAPDGQSVSFGALTKDAAALPAPAEPPRPKPKAELGIVGRPQTQREARDIVTGKQRYALDLPIEGAMPVVWARPPQVLGRLASYDDSRARAMPGVIDVKPVTVLADIEPPVDGGRGSYNSGVAVMAETFGQALAAVEEIEAQWSPGTADGLSDTDIRERLRAESLPFAVPPVGAQTIEGEFDFAAITHAPMETQAAVADVREDSAVIWGATKAPILGQQFAAKAVGLPQEAVTVHVLRGGGSFGSRLVPDNIMEAAATSKAFGRPVKLMYSRSDDTKHGRKRGHSFNKLRFTLVNGAVAAYEHRQTNVYCDLSHGLGEALTAVGATQTPGQAGFAETVWRFTVHSPYNLGVITETINEADINLHTCALRQVYSPTAGPPHEIMIDEVAAALGKDPVGYRRELVRHEAGRRVIDKVAEMGNWGRPMAPGTAQGFGYYFEYKAHNAWLVEIDTNGPEPRVTAAYGATQMGFPVNPSGIESMMLGGLADGISQVLRASVHLDNGGIRESSFSDFKYVTQRHYPRKVETYVFPDDGTPVGGAGEHAVAAASAAVANAYARATGTKIRSFPINH